MAVSEGMSACSGMAPISKFMFRCLLEEVIISVYLSTLLMLFLRCTDLKGRINSYFLTQTMKNPLMYCFVSCLHCFTWNPSRKHITLDPMDNEKAEPKSTFTYEKRAVDVGRQLLALAIHFEQSREKKKPKEQVPKKDDCSAE